MQTAKPGRMRIGWFRNGNICDWGARGQSRAGLGHAPRTILTGFSRIHAADIVLPLADATRRELRIRSVVRPDTAQAILIERLGLALPQRLKAPTQL
jgi:hypothetical protein